MIALIYQSGAVLLQFGTVLVVTVVLLAWVSRIRQERRTYVRLGVLATGIAALWSLHVLQGRVTHYAWEQEVKLGVGQSILIRRYTEFGHYGELAQINRAKSVVEDFGECPNFCVRGGRDFSTAPYVGGSSIARSVRRRGKVGGHSSVGR